MKGEIDRHWITLARQIGSTCFVMYAPGKIVACPILQAWSCQARQLFKNAAGQLPWARVRV